MKIIEELKKNVLNEQIYKRKDVDGVKQAINRLQVEVPNSFIEFYMEFEGPFWEETFGLELLDIIEERDNIENLTCICREEYLFPKQFLVLSGIVANEIIVLDTAQDKVYKVDFEGGDEKLKNGELIPTWDSFENFIKIYFNIL